MRPVKIKVWEKIHWSSDFKEEGIFHQWANAYEEFESGPGNYTVALVELKDGTIGEVLPSNLIFTDVSLTPEEAIIDENDKPE